MAPHLQEVEHEGVNGNGVATNGVTNGDHVYSPMTNGHSVNGNGVTTNGHSNHESVTNGHHDATFQPSDDDVAIVGMAMRLPGGVSNAESFWDMLVNKRDGRCRIPSNRFDADAWYGPGKKNHIKTKHGYFLEDARLAGADTSFWSITPKEAPSMDPQQRLMLEVAYECLENAGETKWKGANIGCYVGVYGEDWHDMIAMDTQNANMYRLVGGGDFGIANRVSFELDMNGPSMTIRTACSSSSTGLHEAFAAIKSGVCDSAIVGGSNMILQPGMTIIMSEQGVLSPDGISKTFDEKANGYARGEAISAIYIKKLSKALKDGDNIRAIIKSSCVNSDGKTPGMVVPSATAQEELIRRTYRLAGISDPCATGLVECHGTGTPVGDPIETTAVAKVFGEKGVHITSVKPNLGHGEGASGLSSVIKAVLALEHRTIPPQIHFSKGHPNILWDEGKLKVPLDPTPWPADRLERVSVNSFGVGGANAHCIIDSAASYGLGKSSTKSSSSTSRRQRLLLLSAQHSAPLKAITEKYQNYLSSSSDSLNDLAYTLSNRRDFWKFRSFAVTSGDKPFEATAPVRAAETTPPSIIFTFTGQGAQYAGMGQELMEEPVFRDAIESLNKFVASLPDAPKWSLKDEILKPKETSRLAEAELSQPCCTAVQIGLVDLLTSWGVQPAAVCGHSSGEIGAAYAAGALTAEQAMLAAYQRGQVTRGLKGRGKMAAVGMGRAAVTEFLQTGCIIGCENSPNSVTLSGDSEAVDEVLKAIKEKSPDTFARALKVECAYHSHHMQTVELEYRSRIEKAVKSKACKVPFLSSVTGKLMHGDGDLDASYWQSNLVSPVLFLSAVKAALRTFPDNKKVLLEVGPHSALAGPIRQILVTEEKATTNYIATLVRDADAIDSLLATAGNLWSNNINLKFEAINPPGKLLMDLPGYQWHYDIDHWEENRIAKVWRQKNIPHHDLLGSRHLGDTDDNPTWRNSFLGVESVPWLSDHQVFDDIVFPGAGFICMAGEAIRQLTGSLSYTIRNVDFSKALVIPPNKFMETMTYLNRSRLTIQLDSVWYDWKVCSWDGSAWVRHCGGQIRAGSAYPTEKKENSWSTYQSVKANTEPMERQLSSEVWYRHLKRLGLNYGPRFQLLNDITTSVDSQKAVGTVKDIREETESSYTIHPSCLDAIFHLLGAAAVKGQPKAFAQVAVPIFVDELFVQPARAGDASVADASAADVSAGDVSAGDVHALNATDLSAIDASVADAHATDAGAVVANAGDTSAGTVIALEATSTFSPRGLLIGNAIGMAGDKVSVEIKRIKMAPLADAEDSTGSEPHAAAQLVWKKDIRFLDAAKLMNLAADHSESYSSIERLGVVCILKACAEIETIEPTQDFLIQYKQWLNAQKVKIEQDLWPDVSGCKELSTLSVEDLDAQMKKLIEEIKESKVSSFAIAMERLSEKVVALFSGEVNALDILLEDNVLANIYSESNDWDYSEYIAKYAHLTPSAKYLEIGAGTGGTTAQMLPLLKASGGERMYQSYTYTDISPGFFASAKERFKEFEGLEWAVLDVSKDPLEQGLEAESYNCIIAANVLHATPKLAVTLANAKKLLKPGGLLFLNELTPTTKYINYIMGFLSGWWLGADDGRPDEPYVQVERWTAELEAVGFVDVKSISLGNSMNSVILAQVPYPKPLSDRLTILCDKLTGHSKDELTELFSSKGFEVDFCGLEDTAAPKQDVISFLDLDDPFFFELTEERFEGIKGFTGRMIDSGILWVTKNSQIKCTDPRYSLVMGYSRVLRTELGAHFATLELESFENDQISIIPDVVKTFQQRVLNDEVDPTWEFAYFDGAVQSSRFYPTSVGKELHRAVEGPTFRRLNVGKPGVLQSLGWTEWPQKPLAPHMVEIEVRAVGLNFKDVLIAMGIVEGTANEAVGLGGETAGVILRVGPEVTDLKPGDKVISVAGGSFSSVVTTWSLGCAKMPEGLEFHEAASMPIVHSTVIWSLMNRAMMRKGQSILIHSACGGVGLSAIQISRMIGAEIYCTVSSQEKMKFLVDNCGIAQDHIFQSRDNSFLRDVMIATKGRGVDVVLNSLSGELLQASWDCVAEQGMMVEIGKRDFIGKGQLALAPFEQNRTYMGVDLSLLFERPDLSNMLLNKVMELYAQGHIKPISPIKVFEATKIQEAFRFMQKGAHIGKIVVTMPEDSSVLTSTPIRNEMAIKPDVGYLIVGGLGGLGKSMATFMIENGAKHITFFSRSAGKSEKDQLFLKELEAQGCTAVAVSGSVCVEEDVHRALDSFTVPVAGIIQASMVLKDGATIQMTIEDWEMALAPKVSGTLMLHNAMAEREKTHPLDFFVMLSSVSGMFGNRGQANYAAANTYMDAFAQYRKSLGLAASALVVGVMEDIGFVSENLETLEANRNIIGVVLHEQDLLDSLQIAVDRSSPSYSLPKAPDAGSYVFDGNLTIGVGTVIPFASPANRYLFKRDSRLALWRNLQSCTDAAGGSGGNDADLTLKSFLRDANRDPALYATPETHLMLAMSIKRTLYGFMLKTDEEGEDPMAAIDAPLMTLGMDSLVGIELRNWFRHTVGVELTVIEIMGIADLRALGVFVAGKLAEKANANK